MGLKQRWKLWHNSLRKNEWTIYLAEQFEYVIKQNTVKYYLKKSKAKRKNG